MSGSQVLHSHDCRLPIFFGFLRIIYSDYGSREGEGYKREKRRKK